MSTHGDDSVGTSHLAGIDPLDQVLLGRLRERLRHQRRRNGEPALREISRRLDRLGQGTLSHVAVGGVLRCEKIPSWRNLELIVKALDGDVEEFRTLWLAILNAQDEQPPHDSTSRIEVNRIEIVDPDKGTLPEFPEQPPPSLLQPAEPVGPADLVVDRGGSSRPSQPWRLILASKQSLASAVVGVLVLSALVYQWASPGIREGCFTMPSTVFTDGMSAVVRTSKTLGVDCVGFTDSRQVGLREDFTFGKDSNTRSWQARVLDANQPLGQDDLTVIWLGALSCDVAPAPAAPECADRRDYQAEREDLQGLLLAQAHGRQPGRRRVHVVLANAGQNVQHADRVARLIVKHRKAFGPRLVVFGGGDSRTVTKTAINTLLDAGIPFITHTLNADPDKPGRPFINRAGYLQLGPTNQDYVKDALAWLTKRLPPTGGRLVIFQEPDPDDLYTTSLVTDLLNLAPTVKPLIAPRHVKSLQDLDSSICRNSRASLQAVPPTVVFFASRWNRFSDFARKINTLCGPDGPYLVMSDGSVSRFMNNDPEREATGAPWPIMYYTNGYQCTELIAQRDQGATPQARTLAGNLLDQARQQLQVNCLPGSQLGAQVAPTWDSIALAGELLSTGTPPNLADLTGTYDLSARTGTTGSLMAVSEGQIQSGGIPVTRLCVAHVNAGPRSSGSCDKIFPAMYGTS